MFLKKWLSIFNFKQFSKTERLIYIIIFLWVAFGVMGIIYDTNLTNLAGYYASLILFVSTYIWGEHKRTSTCTSVFKKGKNSSRENLIYITIVLWNILGIFGILYHMNINNLTVYFTSLTPFVSSYIIYKTTKGADLPVFDDAYKKRVDTAMSNADTNTKTTEKKTVVDGVTVSNVNIDNDIIPTSINNQVPTFSIYDPNKDNEDDVL